MTTFRNLPLSFLCGRQSVGGLVFRAEDWRKRGFKAADMDVAGLFDQAAASLTSARSNFEGILLLVKCRAGQEAIAELCRRMPLEQDLPDECLLTARRLRDEGHDPYGGSIDASLEMAAEEITHLGACVERMILLCETSSRHDEMEAVVLDALDIAPDKAVPTHDAPRSLM